MLPTNTGIFLYYRLPFLFPEFFKLMALQYCINPLPRVLKEKQAGGHCPLKILETIFYISTCKKRLLELLLYKT